jgi:hypothetical protein
MNSNASEPARSSLVGHPPIVASSIALTNQSCTPPKPAQLFISAYPQIDIFSGENRGIIAYVGVCCEVGGVAKLMGEFSVHRLKKSGCSVLLRPFVLIGTKSTGCMMREIGIE